jgi:hypothetical protein
MRWPKYVTHMGLYIRNFCLKPEGKRPLGRRKHRWRIILKWILTKKFYNVDFIHLAHNRAQWRFLVETVMNLQVSQGVDCFLTN